MGKHTIIHAGVGKPRRHPFLFLVGSNFPFGYAIMTLLEELLCRDIDCWKSGWGGNLCFSP